MNDLEVQEPMSAQECAQLLGMAAAVDPKVAGADPIVLRVWFAELRRVPFRVAQEAVLDWYRSERYRETRDSVSPADIVGWWRDRRRHAEESRELLPVVPERIRSGIDRVFAALAERKALAAGLDPETAVDVADSEAQSRRLMQSVRCPWEPCAAQPGRPCTGSKGLPLSRGAVHDSRKLVALDEAGFSSAPA